MNAAPSVYRGVFPQDISYIKGGEGFTFNDQTAVSRSSFYSQSSKTYKNKKFFSLSTFFAILLLCRLFLSSWNKIPVSQQTKDISQSIRDGTFL
jgi:hypothetical protein